MDAYRFTYDDPYKVLAHCVLSYRPADVIRMLTDNSYLATCIQKEVRELDIGGYFLDCIIEDVLARKKRMEMCHELDKLATYFYSQLDKERLREEIRVALKDIGIDVEVYSTGGSASVQAT